MFDWVESATCASAGEAIALSSSARSRVNGSTNCACAANATTAISSRGERYFASVRAAAFMSANSRKTLGLASSTRATLAGSLDASKWAIGCSMPSSKTRKSSRPSPRNGVPSAESTRQLTSTRLTRARMFAGGPAGAAGVPFKLADAPAWAFPPCTKILAPSFRDRMTRNSPVAESRWNSRPRSRRCGRGSFSFSWDLCEDFS